MTDLGQWLLRGYERGRENKNPHKATGRCYLGEFSLGTALGVEAGLLLVFRKLSGVGEAGEAGAGWHRRGGWS